MKEDNIPEDATSDPNGQSVQAGAIPSNDGGTSQIDIKTKGLRCWFTYILFFLLISISTFFWSINLAVKDAFASWDLYDVGYALLDYFETNAHVFPASEEWCDVLMKESDKYYSLGRYADNNKEDFPYTLNKHILRCHDIPKDMVVLFYGKPGWNQVGDIESVKNNDRLRAFLGDGRVHTFRKKELPYLRWKLEDSGEIPAPVTRSLLVVISSLLAIIFLILMLLYLRYLKIFWILAVVIGAVSAGAGAFFGSIAENTYYHLSASGDYISPWVGSIWGFAVGVLFIVIIGSIFAKHRPNVSMAGYGAVIGAITGLVASSIVHAYLIIAYEEPSCRYLLAGSCYGIVAGMLLGWICSGLIRLYKNQPCIQGKG